MNPASLDGNAAAGDLADVFAFDVTTAIVTCATCHHTQAVATLHAYLHAPGTVLRCSSCDAVQIRLVRARPNGRGSTSVASTCSRFSCHRKGEAQVNPAASSRSSRPRTRTP